MARKRMKKKKKFIGILVVLVLCGIAWYGQRAGWFAHYGPNNLPTAEERRRMAEIDKISATVAPNAKAGVGVVPQGSKPVMPPAPEATTTEEATSSSDTITEQATSSEASE